MSPDPNSAHGDVADNTLRAWRTGIDTYQEPVVYMRRDCAICRSEGFATLARPTHHGFGHHRGHPQ